jgi:hypothetical protein
MMAAVISTPTLGHHAIEFISTLIVDSTTGLKTDMTSSKKPGSQAVGLTSPDQLTDVRRDLASDFHESFVDVARDRVHPNGSCESDQSDHQRILDQILAAIFAENLRPDIPLCNKLLHAD